MQPDPVPDYSPYYISDEIQNDLKPFEEREVFNISISEPDERGKKVENVYWGSFILVPKGVGVCAVFLGQRYLTDAEIAKLRDVALVFHGSLLSCQAWSSGPVNDRCERCFTPEEAQKLVEFARRRAEARGSHKKDEESE